MRTYNLCKWVKFTYCEQAIQFEKLFLLLLVQTSKRSRRFFSNLYGLLRIDELYFQCQFGIKPVQWKFQPSKWQTPKMKRDAQLKAVFFPRNASFFKVIFRYHINSLNQQILEKVWERTNAKIRWKKIFEWALLLTDCNCEKFLNFWMRLLILDHSACSGSSCKSPWNSWGIQLHNRSGKCSRHGSVDPPIRTRVRCRS